MLTGNEANLFLACFFIPKVAEIGYPIDKVGESLFHYLWHVLNMMKHSEDFSVPQMTGNYFQY